MPVLPAAFFRRPADVVARDLLGCVLVARTGRGGLAARIVETEAYLGADDPASHAFGGRRHAGNASIYGPPGSWYVYRSYGLHWCANLVCAPAGRGQAVLLRALEPLDGLARMRRRRRGRPDRELCAGPGRLTAALGITRALLDGRAMRGSAIEVVRGTAPAAIAAGPRVGITRAVDWPLRFVDADSRWLSRPLRAGPA